VTLPQESAVSVLSSPMQSDDFEGLGRDLLDLSDPLSDVELGLSIGCDFLDLVRLRPTLLEGLALSVERVFLDRWEPLLSGVAGSVDLGLSAERDDLDFKDLLVVSFSDSEALDSSIDCDL